MAIDAGLAQVRVAAAYALAIDAGLALVRIAAGAVAAFLVGVAATRLAGAINAGFALARVAGGHPNAAYARLADTTVIALPAAAGFVRVAAAFQASPSHALLTVACVAAAIFAATRPPVAHGCASATRRAILAEDITPRPAAKKYTTIIPHFVTRRTRRITRIRTTANRISHEPMNYFIRRQFGGLF
jgi:hypothetical protein